MNETDSKSVRVPEPAYKILKEHAEKTGKNMSFLIARAILRCYAKEGAQ